MPLQLGGVETQRRQQVTWNPAVKEEVLEANARISELIKQGFRALQDNDPAIDGYQVLVPPQRDPNIGVFRVLSENGDDRIVWDRRSGPEVKEAYKQFNDFIKKGYTAYAVNAAGQKGHKIDSFDPSLEEIIMIPGTMPG